jgi:hypothetical protein
VCHHPQTRPCRLVCEAPDETTPRTRDGATRGLWPRRPVVIWGELARRADGHALTLRSHLGGAEAPGEAPSTGTFGAPPARRADRRLGTPDRLDQRCRSLRVGRGPGRRPRNVDDTDDRVSSDLASPARGSRSDGRPARRASGTGPCRGPCAALGR